MKVGFLGGIILLILTLVFSYMAIQNNKIAKEITINAFDLQKQTIKVKESQSTQVSIDDSNKSELNVTKIEAVQTESKWDKFDKKFEGFDEKFKNF